MIRIKSYLSYVDHMNNVLCIMYISQNNSLEHKRQKNVPSFLTRPYLLLPHNKCIFGCTIWLYSGFSCNSKCKTGSRTEYGMQNTFSIGIHKFYLAYCIGQHANLIQIIEFTCVWKVYHILYKFDLFVTVTSRHSEI